MPISIVSADVTGACGLGKRKVAFQVTFPCRSRTRSGGSIRSTRSFRFANGNLPLSRYPC